MGNALISVLGDFGGTFGGGLSSPDEAYRGKFETGNVLSFGAISFRGTSTSGIGVVGWVGMTRGARLTGKSIDDARL